jgi:hypothetical protein
MLGTGIFSKNPPYRVFPAADDPNDLRGHIVSLLRLRPSPFLRIEIEIEIVYNMYRVNRLFSIGPPKYAM